MAGRGLCYPFSTRLRPRRCCGSSQRAYQGYVGSRVQFQNLMGLTHFVSDANVTFNDLVEYTACVCVGQQSTSDAVYRGPPLGSEVLPLPLHRLRNEYQASGPGWRVFGKVPAAITPKSLPSSACDGRCCGQLVLLEGQHLAALWRRHYSRILEHRISSWMACHIHSLRFSDFERCRQLRDDAVFRIQSS